MDFNLWIPDIKKNLMERFNILNNYKVSYSSYDNYDYLDVGFKLVNMYRDLVPVKSFTYITSKNLYHFADGGVEGIVGQIHYKEVHKKEDINIHKDLECLMNNLKIPIYVRCPDDFKDKESFISLYSEIHIIDKEEIELLGLDRKFYYFLLPGIKYVEQNYIQNQIKEFDKRVWD